MKWVYYSVQYKYILHAPATTIHVCAFECHLLMLQQTLFNNIFRWKKKEERFIAFHPFISQCSNKYENINCELWTWIIIQNQWIALHLVSKWCAKQCMKLKLISFNGKQCLTSTMYSSLFHFFSMIFTDLWYECYLFTIFTVDMISGKSTTIKQLPITTWMHTNLKLPIEGLYSKWYWHGTH